MNSSCDLRNPWRWTITHDFRRCSLLSAVPWVTPWLLISALCSCTGLDVIRAPGGVLHVGPGLDFASLSAAVSAADDGDVIEVQAGTYVDDFPLIAKRLTIRGVGGMARFTADEEIPNRKAIFITRSDVVVDHIELSGARVNPYDNNGAGIRYEGGNLTLVHCYVHDNQMGILGGDDPNGHVAILDSEFAYQSRPDGGIAHQIYLGRIARLEVARNYLHETSIGHHIKSRAAETNVHDNVIDDGEGTASYEVDVPNGGTAVIRHNIIRQGPNSDNEAIISYGEEGMVWERNALRVEDNVISNLLKQGAIGVQNRSSVTAEIRRNTFYHLPRIATGPLELAGNVVVAEPPAIPTERPWAVGFDTVSSAFWPMKARSYDNNGARSLRRR
jgi:hypothetical protein